MLEQKIQMEFVEMLESHEQFDRIKFTMIANDTYTPFHNQKNLNTRMGLRRGLPDMFLIVNNTALFIEFKTPTGVVSPFQSKWIEAINNTSIKAYVCRSAAEAMLIINKLLI